MAFRRLTVVINRVKTAKTGWSRPLRSIGGRITRGFSAAQGFRPPCPARTPTPSSPTPHSSTAATPPTSKTSTPNIEADPAAVDAEWRAFFQSLKDEKSDVIKSARGASWKNPNWPVRPSGDLVAALDGQWAETEKKIGEKISATAQAKGVELSSADVMQATRDSIHALMLIRAYRMRGHFHAKLDPLGARAGEERRRAGSALLRLHRGRPRSQNFSRQGARSRIRVDARDRRHPAPHVLPDARRRIHAHLQRRPEKLDPGTHRGPRQGDHLHARRQARDPQQTGRSRGFREISRREIHRHEALRPRWRRSPDPGA